MDEKDRKLEEKNGNMKLEWIVPKLLFLQKNKTDGGKTYPATTEGSDYQS